jgi:hypothetical protein
MHFYMHSYLHKNFILVESGCYKSPLTDVFLLYLAAKLLLRVPPPMLACTLWLSGMGVKSLDRHYPI